MKTFIIRCKISVDYNFEVQANTSEEALNRYEENPQMDRMLNKIGAITDDLDHVILWVDEKEVDGAA